MAEESVRSAINAISARLQEELEAQLTQLNARQHEELEQARRAVEAEADSRWSARVDAVRAEWTTRLEAEVAAARADTERRMVAESMRLRVEAEQLVADTAARLRQEMDAALAREREEQTARTGEEKAQWSAEREHLTGERHRLAQELDALREQLDTVRRQLDDLRAAQHELEGAVHRERSGREAAEAALQQERSGREGAEAALQHERSERQAAEAALQHERTQWEQHAPILQQERALREAAEAALQQERQAREQAEIALAQERHERSEHALLQARLSEAAADMRVAERQAQLATVERLLAAIRTMDAERSLSDVLGALVVAAAAEAPRVALFIVNGAKLRPWKSEGFGRDTAPGAELEPQGIFAEVLRRGEPVATAPGDGPQPPAFANLPSGRAALALPLLVGGQAVALLYADDGAEEGREAPASWPEAVQILGRHASVNLAHLTAARAADAMRRSLAPAAPPSAGHPALTGGSRPAAAEEDGTTARRYARLLVSEIKLYNEAAVHIGRQKRDLLERLKPEIDRARRMYEQRVPPGTEAATLFQQELVQTLADGDPSLLGGAV